MVVKLFGLLLILCVAPAIGETFGEHLLNFLDKELVFPVKFGEKMENVSLTQRIGKFIKALLDCSLIETSEITTECKGQLLEICKNQPNVGIRMLDAASKIPSGMMEMNRIDLGNFDECLSIDYRYGQGTILGKYCTGGLVIPDIRNISNQDLYWKLAICIPDQCNAMDLKILFKYPFFDDSICTSNKSKPWGTGNIVTLVIVCCILLLMILSTVYDYAIQKLDTKPYHPLLKAFSVLTNLRKILQTSEGNKEQIEVFHGMKSISMIWVIAGHGFVGFKTISLSNYYYGIKWRTAHLYALYINASPMALDTFFYISGFLLAYNYLKVKHNSAITQMKLIPSLYIHRYLRLTPPLMMLYLTSVYLLPYLGDGPLYNKFWDSVTATCEKHWWSFLLYVQNYYNYDELCITHTWYLSADMQIFVFSPLLMIPLAIGFHHKKFELCMFGMLLVNIIFTFLPLFLALQYRDYTNGYNTHSRIISYTMGIMFGSFMREKRHQPFLFNANMTKSSRSEINLCIWAIILLSMLAACICYQLVEMQDDYVNRSILYSLIKPVWCIGLSWIVYSSYYGYGGIVNEFLGQPVFQVGSKLSYSIYLVHGIVICYDNSAVRIQKYFSAYVEFYHWCGYFILSVILAFVWTLAFESPMLMVEKFIFGGLSNRAKEHKGRSDSNTAKDV